LSKEEYKSGKFKTELGEFGEFEDFSEAKNCGANLLAKKPDGSCIYLKNNKCRIHTERPKVCRSFFCTTKAKKFQKMVEIIKDEDKEKISSVFRG